MDKDREPLICRDGNTSTYSEDNISQTPANLRGPSLEPTGNLGISVRFPEDHFPTGISLRTDDVLDDIHKLDDMKQFIPSQHSTVNLDETDLKIPVSNDEFTPFEQTSQTNISERPPNENSGTVPRDTDVCMIEMSSDDISEPWFASRHPDPKDNNTGVAPLLSEGKLYHAFFSYDIKDRDWVREIVDRLESPDLGFRCSTHERDFQPGKRITENITEHITVSEKTVLVLSPNFLESPWCRFEIELGMVLSMEEKQMMLVPVMVRNCEIPNSLKTLTYVDATSDQECWFQRLLDAITTRDALQPDFHGTRSFTIHPRYSNMDVLTELSSSYSCLTGETLKRPYLPDVLTRPGIQITQDKFDEVMSKLRTKHPLFCLWSSCCDSTLACTFTHLSLLTLAITGSIIFGTQYMYYENNDIKYDGVLNFASSLAIVFIFMICPLFVVILVFWIQRLRRISRLRKTQEMTNRILLENNVLVGITVKASACILFRTRFTFWYYNTTECTRHLIQLLEELSVNANSMEVALTQAKNLIIEHSAAYTRAYTEGRLMPEGETRHVRNAICLCQYVESKHFK